MSQIGTKAEQEPNHAEEPSGMPTMPISLIQAVLGVSFALVWVFIGAMILRDGRFSVRGESASHGQSPATHRGSTGAPVRQSDGRKLSRVA